MKSLLIILVLFSSLAVGEECYLPIKSSWLKITTLNQKLRIDIANDRNLYISYYDLKNDISVELAHKHYSCDGKFLYVVTEDQTVALFAAMEDKGNSQVTFHFVDKNQFAKMSVPFHRFR